MASSEDYKIKDSKQFFTDVQEEVRRHSPDQENHLGKILLTAMQRHPKDIILQTDANTGKKEAIGSVLSRSIKLAQAFRNCGLGAGDVVAVMGLNHLDICIPLYASFFSGTAFMGVDCTLKPAEIKQLFNKVKPKMVFCEAFNAPAIEEIMEDIPSQVVIFGETMHQKFMNFNQFNEKHSSTQDIDQFEAVDCDPETTIAIICTTSGSTGLPKGAVITHSNITPMMSIIWTSDASDFASNCRLLMALSPIYWYTAYVVHVQTAIFCAPRVQTSAMPSIAHIQDIINTYKPSWTAMTPALALALLKEPEKIDWTCFETFALGGCAVTEGLIDKLNGLIGKPVAENGYGITEATGRVFYGSSKTPNSLGIALPSMQLKLVDAITGEEHEECNKTGELWIKGPNVCKGYYNDPESTKEAFTTDGWFRTGDLVYKDENQHYHFVDRLKIMLNVYSHNRTFHISPTEIETVLKQLPVVADVAVTGVKQNDIDLPIALVVVQPGRFATEQDIINYALDNLSEGKHLTGGVIFVEALPLMAAGKVDRVKIKQIAKEYYENKQEQDAKKQATATLEVMSETTLKSETAESNIQKPHPENDKLTTKESFESETTNNSELSSRNKSKRKSVCSCM